MESHEVFWNGFVGGEHRRLFEKQLEKGSPAEPIGQLHCISWFTVSHFAQSPHGLSCLQGSRHWLLAQTSFDLHSDEVRQPAWHIRLIQTRPSPHWSLLLQILVHCPPLHTSFGKQSASDEVHFRTQRPLLQRAFGPHSWAVLHF